MEDLKDVLKDVGSVVGRFVCLVVALAIVGAPFIWLRAYQEAATFNRFTTGPKATAWDALWVELRVEADR